MVRPITNDHNSLRPYTMHQRHGRRKIACGVLKKGKPSVWIRFPQYLFDKIRAEAVRGEVGFNTVVIKLCEASIEGIE